MLKILTSPIAGTLVGAVCYMAVMLMTWKAAVGKIAQAPATAGHTEEASAAPVETPPPSWVYNNAEVEQLLQELREQKERLGDREKQLNELAARLQSERQELTVLTQSVGNLQKEFDQNILRVKDDEAVNLKKLAKVYSAMDPQNASVVLKQLDDSTLIKIFMFMKDSVTSPLLEAMSKGTDADAKRVAVISEKLRLVVNLPKPPTN